MYNGTIHDTVITPRTSNALNLDKKADLNELSQQMKLNIAQLKSLLGIKAKDEEYDLKAIEELTLFGGNLKCALDSKEDELKILQRDISNLHGLYMKNRSSSYISPRKGDTDAVSLPATPRNYSTSSILESSNFTGIPSKRSAFSPRLSTSSLPGKDLNQRELEVEMALRKYSRESESAFMRSMERINDASELRRKSSSSLSSSLKSSPRNVRTHDANLSHSSSSNNRRTSARSISDIAENSYSSERRNRSRLSSAKSSRSINEKSETDLGKNSGRGDRVTTKNSSSQYRSATLPNRNYNGHRNHQTRRDSKKLTKESTYDVSSSECEEASSEYDVSSSSEGEGVRTNPTSRKKEVKRKRHAVNKFEEVERKLSLLQQRCDILEKENNTIKKEQQSKNDKRILDLKHRNSELVNVARRLEQKARALQAENQKRSTETVAGTQDLLQQKKGFAKLKTRMETEHSRAIVEKEHQVETLKKQVEDLKKTLRQAKNAKVSQDEGTLTSSLRQSQKEALQLQKLASANSKKVTIRSLSMPVTARQKILEETNRSLRRQLSQLEESYRKELNGNTVEDIKSELDEHKTKCNTLEKEAKELKIQVVNLESQLQIAKVESSDVNIRLNELQKSFTQLEEEYNTVHEQLSVAIKERDAAIKQCKENTNKIQQMELRIRNMDSNHVNGDGDAGRRKNEEELNKNKTAQYQLALEKLQAKIAELEKQCHDQNETNRKLNEQLIQVMKTSPCTSPTGNNETLIIGDSTPVENTSPNNGREVVKQPVKLPVVTSGHEINTNNVNGNATHYHLQENDQRSPRIIANVGGNEDTEVEDFLEEELNQTMDNNESGKLRVYIAKYTYNPFDGPNDSPEAELPLVAGDYVYVYGTMDEDGFFEGELMNGRRGLVPSNFLEPVHEDGHIYGKLPAKLENSGGSARCTSSEVSQSESIISSCTSVGSGRLSQRDSSDSNAPVLIHGVLPYPKKLRIDKQLSHSLIIGWVAPHLNDGETIDEYHVFVSGEFRTAVSGNKQKAVVENINHDQVYRISVCAVSQWGISDENLCVLSHGRGADLSPTSVRMEKVGASSVRVAWTPSSSQQCHIVMVEQEGTDRFSPGLRTPSYMTHIVQPPAYRFTFGNLRPNVSYKVTVNAKGSQEKPRSFARFTTPEAGPPDPPLSVQIEECQNTNYLLITWLPVTLNTLGTSNGVVVKGYALYVGDTKLCDVQSPTVDQCTIRAQTLADAFSQQLSTGPDKKFYKLSKQTNPVLKWNKHVPPSITIRTHAVNGQESDHSDPCVISHELYDKLLALIKENTALSGEEAVKDIKIRKRPPLIRSVESTDIDVSFSSDISVPGLHTPKQRDGRQSGASSVASSGRKTHFNKTKILEQTRVVPSIEITHDTSSEEDLNTQNAGVKVSSNTNKPSSSNKNHETKNSDNDDAASVSSSHTSSSAGGTNTKVGKSNSVASRAARAIRAHKLQRGESAEYSNPEDYMSSTALNSRINLNPSDTEKRSSSKYNSPDNIRRHQHKHHNMRHSGRRPHSVTSDDQSQGSHHSRSSSHGPSYLRHGRANGGRNIVRQTTISSQSGSEIASEMEPQYPVDKSRVSLYVALYNYDPKLMSPNTDSFDEELSFTEGQLIKVYGTKDEDGFYYGETHTHKRGYVPCNMVSEVEVESMQMLLDLHERGHLPSASPDEDEQSTSEAKTKSGSSQLQNGNDTPDGNKPVTKTRYFLALFDYDPSHLSPNIDNDVEISFSEGDIIKVTGGMDDDGFYKGKCNSKEGLVPSNFLEEISEQQAEELKHKTEKASTTQPVPKRSPNPKPARNNNTSNMRSMESGYATGGSHVNPNRVDNALVKGKKGNFISKGKKLFKKLGGSQDGKRR